MLGVEVTRGTGSVDTRLAAGGLHDATAVLATEDSDIDNLEIALYAAELAPDARLVVSLSNERLAGELRAALAQSSSLAQLDDLLARLDPAQPFPEVVLGQPRGRTTGGRGVSLPEGWLDSAGSRDVPFGAELTDGGG